MDSPHQCNSFGKRPRTDLNVRNYTYTSDTKGHNGENEPSFTKLQVPVPLRARSFEHNVDRADAQPYRRASIPSHSIFLPLRSPQENSDETEHRKQQRSIFPMYRQPGQWSLQMRARRITYPTTREYVRKASIPSPPNESDFERCLEECESTSFATPKQLATLDSICSQPDLPITFESDDVTLDEIPPSILLPMLD
uniref:Uncharacterized protein n=1 Tax=Amphora coffeiformis TaxID=265554 RepID=A0A7S3P6I6_9STRA|eukprot:scaffold7020_cov214-Amphora_coffeaeformis.AAC.4